MAGTTKAAKAVTATYIARHLKSNEIRARLDGAGDQPINFTYFLVDKEAAPIAGFFKEAIDNGLLVVGDKIEVIAADGTVTAAKAVDKDGTLA